MKRIVIEVAPTSGHFFLDTTIVFEIAYTKDIGTLGW